MTTLQDRLRASPTSQIMQEAASALDALRAENERLRKACEHAAEWLDGWGSAEPYLSELRAALQGESNGS